MVVVVITGCFDGSGTFGDCSVIIVVIVWLSL